MSSKDILKLKQEIRKSIQKKRRHQPDNKTNKYSLKIWERLNKLKEFKKAKNVMFYAALPEEVQTSQMIKEAVKSGKRILLPFVDKNKRMMSASFLADYVNGFEKGPFGITEPKKQFRKPADKRGISLVIVPGVAFDLKGNRIGFGGGYYDRFLKTLKKKVKIALAFDFQIKKELPCCFYDIRMDKIVTEKGVIDCR